MKHHCHWQGCKVETPAAMWGCHKHWFTLPKRLRDLIWSTYVPGQEITKTPSRAYMHAIRAVDLWIEQHEKAKQEQLKLL